MKDIHNSLKISQVLNPALVAATATSSAISVADYKSLEVSICVGAITDGTHTPKLQECDTSGGTYTDVAAADQLGTFAALASNVKQDVGYIGNKAFVKLVVTVTGSPATGGIYGAQAIQGHAIAEPV